MEKNIQQNGVIDIKNPEEVNYWTSLLNISSGQLKEIVKKAGNLPVQVMNYIEGKMDDKNGDDFFYYNK